MAWYDELDAFLKNYHSSRIVYNRFRIPRLPPVEDTTSPPGHLCWGTVGALPSAEPVPLMSFNVVSPQETHTEIQRKATDVRIENPDDPTQYVIVSRSDEVLFMKSHTGWKNTGNVDGASDFGDFAPSPIELTAFVPLGTEKPQNLLVKFDNKQPPINSI